MRRVAIVLGIIILGITVLVYPIISNYFMELNGSYAIEAYQEQIAEFDEAEVAVAWAEAEQYNESLTGSPVHDPFIEGTGMAMPEDYWRVLDLGGLMGSVEIPKINVNLPIYHGTSERVLREGAGHLEGSTMPIGGPSRHAVLTGHSGLTSARLFTDLTEMQIGDLFYLHVLGQTLAYKVDQIKIIEPQFTDDLKRVDGRDLCTLLTCTPYGINSHRLLVRGERVDYVPEEKAAIIPVRTSEADDMVMEAAIITSTIMLSLIIIVLIARRRRERAEAEPVEAKPRKVSTNRKPSRRRSTPSRRRW